MKLQIVTPSRIHTTLIDMNGSLGRVDGGVGFSLDLPNWKIIFERNDEQTLVISTDQGKDESVIKEVSENIMGELNLNPKSTGITIKVNDSIPQHVGLGSKTQLSIAIADGITRVLDLDNPPYHIDKLAAIAHRGGTSGIGVRSYVGGAFILDGGHSFGAGKEKQDFLPSSATKASPGPVLMTAALPEQWHVVCVIPDEPLGAHDSGEISIFKKYCPIPVEEVQALCHLLLVKLLPAVYNRDFIDVCFSINKIQGLGFKKVEIGLRGPKFARIMEGWKKAGAPCVGLSSFGPCLYSFAENPDQAKELVDAVEKFLEGDARIFISRFCNSGATIMQSKEMRS